MVELRAALADRVAGWRTEGYPTDRFPAIAEILRFATEDHDGEAPGSGTLRYLRAAQLRALETYWYLRLVEGTPRIPDLDQTLFPTTSDRLAALGLAMDVFKNIALDAGYDGLIERIRTDDEFARADGRLRIRIDDFLSPSIIERLSGEEVILAPSIDDWRAMVDSVAIDSAWDGAVFDVELIDIPARRSDLVDGAYVLDLPAEHADRPAAVRITDMLGEEVLVVEPHP